MDDTALSLEDAVAAASTGDIWLFRGRSLADRAIQTVTNSPVNHVGMVVALDDLPPLLWHAELGRSLTDVWTGERQRGVQLHQLRAAVTQWNERYGQRAWVRQLRGTIEREHEDRLIEVIDRFDGRAFPTMLGLAQRLGDRPLPPPHVKLRDASTARSSSPRPTSTWACCRASGRRAGMTPAASGAATASRSWRRLCSKARPMRRAVSR